MDFCMATAAARCLAEESETGWLVCGQAGTAARLAKAVSSQRPHPPGLAFRLPPSALEFI
jgi:hypothetical protein